MPRRLAATFVLVTVAAVVGTWVVAQASDSLVALVAIAVILAVAAGAVGLATGSRLSRTFRALVRRDQAVAVAASHELRTPITALRLSLEDLTLWKETPGEVSDELHRAISELDRLSDAVTRMLASHRQDQQDGVGLVDVAALTAGVVDGWRPRLDASREVVVDAGTPSYVRLDAGSVNRIVSTVLDQFAGGGQGTVSIDVARLGRTVRVRVGDQSPPRFAPGVIHGRPTGKGGTDGLTLDEAGAVAEALGGYLAVAAAPTTRLALILPSAPENVTT
ncbi:sensor histidine kinase [Aeromicrobium stalagmiti]|uniref:sensor histidine kinase n=1 Tax=Aeromicrobium stalagmiti TaxID=2738988 RepID=UPI0015689E45|nr:HAMP domain-containing sensor histidine kinase [Aeromicrobium stalagmiti]NRQ48507.1 HAMP domain-containing histidine kinase [Aeromicrobium stalagmiti]